MSERHSVTYIEFIPQKWVGDYAVEADRLGPTAFVVGTEELEGIEPFTHEADRFKDHENAPHWVKDWDGPFEFDWFVDEDAKAEVQA